VERRDFVKTAAILPVLPQIDFPKKFNDITKDVFDFIQNIRIKFFTPKWHSYLVDQNHAQVLNGCRLFLFDVLAKNELFSGASARTTFHSGINHVGTCWSNIPFDWKYDVLIKEEDDPNLYNPKFYLGGSYFTTIPVWCVVKPLDKIEIFVKLFQTQEDASQRFGLAYDGYQAKLILTADSHDLFVERTCEL
jgi:hypothetical protein